MPVTVYVHMHVNENENEFYVPFDITSGQECSERTNI
jgi:hypothetical protein